MTEPAGGRTPRRRGRPAAEPAAGVPGDAGDRARSRRRDDAGPPATDGAGPTRAAGARGASAGAARTGRGRGTAAEIPAADPAGAAGKGGKAGKAGKAGRTRTASGATAGTAARRTGRSGTAGAARSEADPVTPPPGDRPEPVRGPGGRWPMADRSVLPTVLGVPPVAAVAMAAALTAVGVLVDLMRIGNLGTVFLICHLSGCVLAVAWVRRTGLFGPMVQPPLLVAAAVPVVVLMVGSPRPGQGVAEQLLVVGAPLVNAFPVMAWTTGTVLVLGLLRVLLQRPVNAAVSAPSGRGAARGAGRTSASPRRS